MVSSSEHGSSNPYNHVFTDSNGEFEVFPLGDARCSNRSSQGGEVFDTGYGTCIAQDGNGIVRFNLWGNTDYRSALERYNVFVFINHEMDNGNETFTEIGLYGSDSNLTRHPSYAFSSAKHRVGPDNYWLNQMTLDDGTALFAGHELWIDNYRYAELYRKVDVKKTTYRILQGIRGSNEDWDWEAAFLNSRATANDVTHNRLSNNLIKEALWDSTPAAYNPFKAGDPEGLARAVVDAYRKGTSELTMLDFKVSNNEIAQMPAGPLGLSLGFEYRYEKVMDDRDPRLDGSTAYTDYEGDTYPLVSDLLNSSPTGDVGGSHRVKSFFTELQIPLAPTANAQLALRFEDSTSVDSALVGKFAVGWDVNDIFKLRASISTAYRAPNIIQVNEKIVVRSGTRNDYSRYRLQQANGISTSSSNLDSRYGMLRQATGAENLKSEESDNTSIGFVLTPVDGLTITADYWTIEKENTIGLFGRSNHTVQDMMLRWANGTNNCGSFMGNPAVVREAPDEDDIAGAAVAGVCPFGTIKYVGDNYLNLATRTIEGYDIGVYYDVDTDFGDFAVRYIGSFIDKFEQVPGGEFAALAAQQAAGQVPADIPLDGFGDLLGQNGNYDEKHRLRLTWSKGSWGASLTGLRKGDFYQSSLTRSDGTRFVIPSMTVFDVTVDYKFSIKGSGNNARIRFAVKNAADERAPTADRYYGYFADAHTDLGRNFYVDFRISL